MYEFPLGIRFAAAQPYLASDCIYVISARLVLGGSQDLHVFTPGGPHPVVHFLRR